MKRRSGHIAAGWYRLDNAARVFAAIASRRNTTVYRIAATLHEPVDLAVLQAALDTVMPRFPYFRVRLRSGLFWHYLSGIPGSPVVRPETRAPCRRITRSVDGPWQFRVLVFQRRISMECSHVLTDGAGAMSFLQALLAEYLARKGVVIPADAEIKRAGERVHPEEAEDAYRRFYDPRIPPPPWGDRAMHLRGVSLAPDACRVILGIVPLAPLRDMSRERGVSLTELLASILLASILDIGPGARRPVAIMMPVDLRRLYQSRTMRNFFLSVTAGIDPRLGSYSLEEILHSVHYSVRGQVTAKSISRQIRRNVGAERNVFIRHIPLLVKMPLKRRLYKQRWGTRHTTVLSNLGRAELPPKLAERVERFEVIPNPSSAHGVGCGVVGYGEHLFISFVSIVAGTGLERAFFTRLRQMGITARVESN